MKTDQTVMKNEADEQNPRFLLNWCNMDATWMQHGYHRYAHTYMFWVSFIGPKDSAEKIRYTLKVRKEEENGEEHLFECTRRCVPCDYSHNKVKSMRRAVILDQETIADAKHKAFLEGQDTDVIYYDLTIHE